MNRFLRTLDQAGYRQYYLAFGDANFRKTDWAREAKHLPNPLGDLVKLFLLQQPVASKKTRRFLDPELIEELLHCGVLHEQGSDLVSNSFYLIFCRSHALFCQMTRHPLAYFGDDSLALATLQSPAPGGKVLDLCAGTGIQSFVAAAHAAQVTGVELQRETWRIAELNRRLNNLGRRVQFVCESAEDFARRNRDQYDRILFNPPLIPMVPGYNFPLAGNGGPDGLALTRTILSLYRERLSSEGCLEFISTGLGWKNRPTVCDQIQAMARRHRLSGRIHLLSQHPIRAFAPLFESAVSVLAADNQLEPARAREILLAHFARLKRDAYWLFFCSLERASRRHQQLSVIDLTKSFWGSWFV